MTQTVLPTCLTKAHLMKGALLGSIAHAIASFRFPNLIGMHSWDGECYCVNDLQGAIGCVVFSRVGVVGLFYDTHSDRNDLGAAPETLDLAHPLLLDMPEAMNDIARRASRYILNSVDGRTAVCVTAALWGQDTLHSADDWDTCLFNGASLLRTQLMPLNDAQPMWEAEFRMTADESRLLSLLATRRIAATCPIVLTQEEGTLLDTILRDREHAGLTLSGLAAVGINR